MRTSILLSSVLALYVQLDSSSSAVADAGDHWCDAPFDWNLFDKIPVYIHPDFAEWQEHSTGVLWTDDEVRRDVEFMLERFMMQAPSQMPPLYFAGFEAPGTAWDADPGFGKLAIRPNLDPAPGHNKCSSYQRGTPLTGVYLVIGITALGADTCTTGVPDDHDSFTEHWWYGGEFETPYDTLVGGIAHELMHGLGFSHTDGMNSCNPNGLSCTDNPGEPQICGLMDTHGIGAEYFELEYSDWDALTTKYGGWENDGRYRRESNDALTWTTLAAGTLQSGPFWGGTRAPHAMPIVATDPSTLVPHVYRWKRSTGAIVDWGAITLPGAQNGQVGIGYNNGKLYAFHGYGQSQSQSVTRKHGSYSYGTPSNWTTVLSSFYISRQGVQGTYDPKSGKLIHVYRDFDNRIMLATTTTVGWDSAATTVFTDVANKAATTPSIACGDSSITYNCILVWATAAAKGSGATYHKLRWSHFYYNGTAFVFSNVYEDSHIMFGPPVVIYKGSTGSNSAFVVGWSVPGQCMYTLHKSTLNTSLFVDERSHCTGTGKHNGPPMMGATTSGLSYAELWTQFNVED